MPASYLSRRDFLKLAALGLSSLALRPRLHQAAKSGFGIRQPSGAVLSAEQQARLHQASLAYLARDHQAAAEVARRIDFVEGRNEDPSNMCGPLSIRILIDAGLLGPWVDVHDFWLLNPDEQGNLLNDTFPTHLYDWYAHETAFREHDFDAFPLQAGDFIYLFAGPSDTFEHIFVVTRVDSGGRAYTVSNFLMPEGMVIEERLLYDPAEPGVGQVYEWVNRAVRNTSGMTGGGGYAIWRVKDGRSLEWPVDAASQELRQRLDRLCLQSSGAWYTWVEEIGGPILHQFNPYTGFHPASTIKLSIVLAFYAWLDEQAIDNWDDYLATDGAGGRSFAQLLEATIVVSEELATEILIDFLGSSRIHARWAAWGLEKSHVFPRRSSARELRDSFLASYQGEWISARSQAHLMDLLQSYTENDDGRLGLLRTRLPGELTIFNKRGSLTSGPMVVADSGIIEAGSRSYFFSAHVHGREGSGYGKLERELDQAIDIFGRYLLNAQRGPGDYFSRPA